MSLKLPFLLCFLLFLIPNYNAAQSNKKFPKLNELIQEGMQDWNIPGLGVVVVKEKKVVYQKNFGTKNVTEDKPIDGKTLFGLGSVTKAFTAIAVALLVDWGNLEWNSRIDDYLDHDLLSEDKINDVRVKDLLTHNMGIEDADLIWYLNPKITSEEAVKRFSMIRRIHPLRGGFHYQNFGYIIAGMLIEKVSGRSWADFVKEEILKPLEMQRTLTSSKQLDAGWNYASPHCRLPDGEIYPSFIPDFDAAGPALMMWSCADDMANYLQFLTTGRTPNGTDLLSSQNFNYLFTPQNIIAPNDFGFSSAEITKPIWTTYGLGWFQQDYRNHKLDFHVGTVHGLSALVAVMHEKELAVCVLVNTDHAELKEAIMLQVIDLYGFGEVSRDWGQAFLAFRKEVSPEKDKKSETPPLSSEKRLPLEDYEGIFESPLIGSVEVTVEGEKLVLKVNDSKRILATPSEGHSFNTIPSPSWHYPSKVDFGLANSSKVLRFYWLGYNFEKKN